MPPCEPVAVVLWLVVVVESVTLVAVGLALIAVKHDATQGKES